MSIWLDNSNNANVLENTYLEGFLDISGGAIQTRNATDHLLVAGDVSFNQVYVEPKIIENFNALISKDPSGVVFSNTAPTQYAYDISGSTANEQLGSSVATSADGSIVAIGAPENAGGGTKRGEVRVYQKDNNSWLQLGSDLNGAADNDEFGHSVDLNGDGTILAVGTKDLSHNTLVYKYDSGSWGLYGNTIENNVSYEIPIETSTTETYPLNLGTNPWSGDITRGTLNYNFMKSSTDTLNGYPSDATVSTNGASGTVNLLEPSTSGQSNTWGSYLNIVEIYGVAGSDLTQPSTWQTVFHMEYTGFGTNNGFGVGFILYYDSVNNRLYLKYRDRNNKFTSSSYTVEESIYLNNNNEIKAGEEYHIVLMLAGSDSRIRVYVNGDTTATAEIYHTAIHDSPQIGHGGNAHETLYVTAIANGTTKYVRWYKDINILDAAYTAMWNSRTYATSTTDYEGGLYYETVTAPLNLLSASTKPKLNKTGDKLTIMNEQHFDNLTGNGQVQTYEYSASDTSWNYLGNKIESAAYNDISGGVVDINQAGDTIAIGYPKGASSSYSYTITADSGLYVIDGVNNPTLTMYRGAAYTLSINASGHPFHMQTTDNGGAYDSANLYTVATGSGTDNGTISFTLPNDAPNTLYYRCQYHSGMGNTINVEDDPGYTKVYKYDSSWNQVGSNITGGTTIAMDGSGDYVAVGYPYANSDAGKVKVYQNISDSWTKKGNDIEGSANDNTGRAIAMSAVGDVLAVNFDTAHSGKGAVSIYQYDSSWNKLANDLSGDTVGDLSGSSIAMNELGTEITIGKPNGVTSTTEFSGGNVTLHWDFAVDGTNQTTIVGSEGNIGTFYDTTFDSTESDGYYIGNRNGSVRLDNFLFPSSQFTIETYIKKADGPEVPLLMYHLYSNGIATYMFWLKLYGNMLSCYVKGSNSNTSKTINYTFSTNIWYHIVLVCDFTGYYDSGWKMPITLYVDGSLVQEQILYPSTVSSVWDQTVTGRTLAIGGSNEYTTNGRAYLKKFKIINKLVTAEEASDLYQLTTVGSILAPFNHSRTFTLGDHTELFKNYVYRNTYSGVHIGTTEEYKSSVDYDTSLDVSGNVDVSGTIILAGDTSLNSTTLINNNLTVDGTTAYKTSVSNVSFTEDVSINQVIKTNTSDNTVTASSLSIHKDLSNNENFNYDNYLQVAGNVLVIDASNTNYGSYTIFAENPKGFTETSNSFIAGKSPANVFNIVNDSNVGVYMNTGSNTFTGTSDANLKKNISEMDDTTKALQELKPCKYNWKTEEDDKEKHAGFIAQEVEKVYPELVEENVYPDGSKYKGVNTSKLIPYMIKEMKELKKEIEELS